MGAGLPSAMMAALMDRQRKVIGVCGDGGFMMNSQELETAVRLKLNLVVLIIEDGGYGMIRWKQKAAGFHDYGLGFNNPDFVKYAEAYGARGTRIRATAELRPSIERAFAQGGVELITVPVDYSENQRVLVDELKAHA
jgi:acetolactate synthase-1/2/3 large subunit